MKVLILLLLPFITGFSAPDSAAGEAGFRPQDHEFHISKTVLRHAPDREQLQVEMHIFIDDLELALEDAGAPRLYIGTAKELPQTGRHIAAYLEKHFAVEWNGKTLPMGVLGYEISDDLQSVWVYLAGDLKASMERVVIRQTVLTETYNDQRNIVVLFASGRSFTLLTDRDHPDAVFSTL